VTRWHRGVLSVVDRYNECKHTFVTYDVGLVLLVVSTFVAYLSAPSKCLERNKPMLSGAFSNFADFIEC
jgi:hypothetical protein